MKWLGIFCLFLTSAGLGMYAARSLRTRLRHTRQLSALLTDFAAHIRYQCLPLEDLLHLYAEHPNYSAFTFIKRVSREFCTEIPMCILWKDAVSADDAIVPEAKTILTNLGNVLGTTDLEGQLAALALHRRQLDELTEQLKETSQQKGELYRRLGVLLGAMLAVMLL